MLKHIWSVLCRRAIVDSSSNNLTISEVIEELTVNLQIKNIKDSTLKSFNVPFEFEVVSFWKNDGENIDKSEYECEIEIDNPKGKKIRSLPQKIKFPTGIKRLRTILRANGIIVEDSGEYSLKVNVKEKREKKYKTVAELPLMINIIKKETIVV